MQPAAHGWGAAADPPEPRAAERVVAFDASVLNETLPGLLGRGARATAPDLLGWQVESTIGGVRTVGRIVEVEAYTGPHDPASHAAERIGRTRRNESMYGPPGIAYVYLIYGVHWCLNIVTGREGFPAAVLVRALEPVEGKPAMAVRRGRTRDLCSGPGRLCQALGITGECDGHSLDQAPLRLLPRDPVPSGQVACSPRIGVTRARERELRFFLQDSPHVSRRTGGTR